MHTHAPWGVLSTWKKDKSAEVFQTRSEAWDKFDLEDTSSLLSWSRDGSRRSQQERRVRGERKRKKTHEFLPRCHISLLQSISHWEYCHKNLHLQYRASQREDQSGHYPRYSGLLDLYFMTREPNLQLQSFYTPLHLSLSIVEMSRRHFEMWLDVSLMDLKASSWVLAFSG